MKFITLSYWFSHNAGLFKGLYYYFGATALLFVIFVGLKLYLKFGGPSKILKKYIKKLPRGFFWFSLLGALFTFLRYQNAYIFSARVWVVLLFIGFVWWFSSFLIKFMKGYKKDLFRQKKRSDKTKYHPKGKK